MTMGRNYVDHPNGYSAGLADCEGSSKTPATGSHIVPSVHYVLRFECTCILYDI
jgi:hypothetical protein